MAIYPDAIRKLLPENRTEPTVHKIGLIYHSIVGSAEGAYGYFLNGTNLESHFIVTDNGTVWQLIDTARDADAQPKDQYISVETEDDGNPDNDPWTNRQLISLTKLGLWAAKTHNFPRRRCPSPTSGGFGYHTMWGAPSAWTPVSKTCPGFARIRQFNKILLPALIKGSVRGEIMYDGWCQYGDDNEDVGILQIRLRRLGFYKGKLDNKFGNKTAEALLALRKSRGSKAKSGKKYNKYGAAAIEMATIEKYGGGKVNPNDLPEIENLVDATVDEIAGRLDK